MEIRFHCLICAAAALLFGGISALGQGKLTGTNAVATIVKSSALQTNQDDIQQPGEKDEDRSAALLRKYRGDLVFVAGKSANASGFIAQYKNRKFFITNAHVLAGNGALSLEALDRSPLQVQSDSAMAAVGHDLIAIPVVAGGNGIRTIEKVDTEVAVGDAVVVFGNALAGGVVNPLLGKVVGLGPRIIEVDSQIEPGSSGGPIIHLHSGKVIGVATYATREEKLSGDKSPRRFGYRLDTVTLWQHIDYKQFQYQNDVLTAVHNLTIQLGNAAEDVTQELPDPVPSAVVGRRVIFTQTIPRHEYESPLIRSAVETYLDKIANSQGNHDEAAANLVDSLNAASQNNLDAAAPTLTYDFFQHGDGEIPGWSPAEANGYENERKVREEIMRELVEHLKSK